MPAYVLYRLINCLARPLALPAAQVMVLSVQVVAAVLGIRAAYLKPNEVCYTTVAHWMLAFGLAGEFCRRRLTELFCPLPVVVNGADNPWHVMMIQLCPIMNAAWWACPLRSITSLELLWSFLEACFSSALWRFVYAFHATFCGAIGLIELCSCRWRSVAIVATVPMESPHPCSCDDAAEVFVSTSTVYGAGEGLFAARDFAVDECIASITGTFITMKDVVAHPQKDHIKAYGIRHSAPNGESGILTPLGEDLSSVKHVWGFANEPPMLVPDLWPELHSSLARQCGFDRCGNCGLVRSVPEVHVYPNAAPSGADLTIRAIRPITKNEEIFWCYGDFYKRQYRPSRASLGHAFEFRRTPGIDVLCKTLGVPSASLRESRRDA